MLLDSAVERIESIEGEGVRLGQASTGLELLVQGRRTVGVAGAEPVSSPLLLFVLTIAGLPTAGRRGRWRGSRYQPRHLTTLLERKPAAPWNSRNCLTTAVVAKLADAVFNLRIRRSWAIVASPLAHNLTRGFIPDYVGFINQNFYEL